ncbi:UNVERIFIED_ORG: hypothetical protein CLV66_112128 [Actinomadura viridilutea]
MVQGAIPPQPQHSDDALRVSRLTEQMATASQSERPALLVELLAPKTSADPADWIIDLVTLVEEHGFSLSQIRLAATDLAWLARTNGQRYPNEDDRGRVLAASDSRTARLCLAYITGQRLRFDFKFEQLHRACVEWLQEFGDDALVIALAAFAALGSRASNGLSLFQRAVDAPDADVKSNQVALTGIWFADHLPEQPQLLLRLSDEMMARGQEDPIVYYRRATAYRKLRRFDDALYEIDRAIDGLAVGDNLVHEQLAQERRAIILSRDLQRQIDESAQILSERITARIDERISEASAEMEQRINEASARLAQRVDVAQEMVTSGLLKMVEILGLFVALIGFLAGSATVVLKARGFGQQAVAMAVVVVGTLTFFGLLRLIVGLRRRARSS